MKTFVSWLKGNGLWKNVFIASLVLVFASQFPPWFSLGSEVPPAGGMACTPAAFIGLFFCTVFLVFHLWRDWHNPMTTILATAGLITFPCFTVLTFYVWPVYRWITDVPNLAMSWNTVQIGYWIALGISVLPLFTYPLYLMDIVKRGKTPKPWSEILA